MQKHKGSKNRTSDDVSREVDTDGSARPKLKRKDYEKKTAPVTCEVGRAPGIGSSRGPEGLHPVRRPRRRRQGRCHQSDHGQGESAPLPGRRPAGTDRARKTQMYFQRYLEHLPTGGEVVIFDRSWYNRAGVERVMGFCTEHQAKRFLNIVPQVEKAMVDSGMILIKYWLEVSPEEQPSRLRASTTGAGPGSSHHGFKVLREMGRLHAGA